MILASIFFLRSPLLNKCTYKDNYDDDDDDDDNDNDSVDDNNNNNNNDE